MSAPLTTVPIITPAIVSKLQAVRQIYDSPAYSALRPTPRQPEKTRFINHTAKFCYVFAENCLKDVDLVATFGTARSMRADEQSRVLAQFFVAVTIYLLAPDDDEHIKTRLLGAENPGIREFWSKYVLPRLQNFGINTEDGIDMMSVLCKKVHEDKSGTEVDTELGIRFDSRFQFELGTSIRMNAAKAKTEFNLFEKEFKESYLDSNGLPRSGETWDSVLERFRAELYRRENHIEDESVTPPPTWLPPGSHAWFLFVCFGPYGENQYRTKRPAFLGGQTIGVIDASATKSRRAAKVRETTPAGPSRVSSNLDETVANVAESEAAAFSAFKDRMLNTEERERDDSYIVVLKEVIDSLERRLERVRKRLKDELPDDLRAQISAERDRLYEELEKQEYELETFASEVKKKRRLTQANQQPTQ